MGLLERTMDLVVESLVIKLITSVAIQYRRILVCLPIKVGAWGNSLQYIVLDGSASASRTNGSQKVRKCPPTSECRC